MLLARRRSHLSFRNPSAAGGACRLFPTTFIRQLRVQGGHRPGAGLGARSPQRFLLLNLKTALENKHETIFVKGELRLFESMPYSLVLGLLHCSRRCKNLKMVEYHFISNFPLLNRQDNQCNVGSGLCPASLRWNRTVCLSQIGAGTQTKFRRMIADAKVGRSKHWRLKSYNRIMLNAVSNPLNSETIRDFERLLIASELIFLWFFHF